MNKNNILEHVGVLGMKWGVRKNRSSVSLSKKTDFEKNTPEAIAARKLKKKRAESLSNKEIQDTLNRINLEKQFREAKKSKGQKLVQDVISTAGRNTLNAATTAVFMHVAKQALEPYGISLGKKEKDKDK